jgi:anthranilate phosphoribosyltransferase
MTIAEFGTYVQNLIERKDLSRTESYRLFRELMLNSQPDLQQGAFLAALAAKGETVDEIVGAWQAIDELDTVHVEGLPEKVLDNSGTGMDGFKTFNVSSAAALVAAAHGIPMARHGARAITSRCGTVDIMEAMGINVECPPELVARSIATSGIGLFNGMSSGVHPGGLGRILSQIRFGTTFNIAASLANPARPRRAMRGIYSRSLLEPVSEVMKQIGFQRALVVHGTVDNRGAGIDELSVCGPSSVCHLDAENKQSFDIVPEEVGLPRYPAAEIGATASLEQEALRFFAVVSGSGMFKGCEDFTALNAGAILWMEGVSPSLSAGVADARHTLASGGALDKLRSWCVTQGHDDGSGVRRLSLLEKQVQGRTGGRQSIFCLSKRIPQ